MMPPAQNPHAMHFWFAGLDALSAILGMVGTYFMAKRYASGFLWGLLFAIVGTFLYLVGRGKQVRRFYTAGQLGNKDIEDAAGDVALGLNLLFVAFLFQLVRISISMFLEKT